MARIRSIHPGTLIDPEFALIPVEGRLMFIYSWTAADDAGNFERNFFGLKMALFPGDEWATVKRVTELVEALISGRFYEPYEVDGKQYLHIRNFSKYQKPDHPTVPRYPLFPGQEYTWHVRQGQGWSSKTERGALPEPPPERSTNEQGTLHEHPPNVSRKNSERSRRSGSGSGLEGRGKEGRGPGEGGKRANASAGASKRADSGKGNGAMKGERRTFTGDPSKEAALTEVVRLITTREIDLDDASRRLRTAGFSHQQINEPAVVAMLQKAAN